MRGDERNVAAANPKGGHTHTYTKRTEWCVNVWSGAEWRVTCGRMHVEE